MHRFRSGIFAVLWLILAGSTAGQMVIYVDENSTGPAHDGSTWCTAYLELHQALSAAGAGTTIRVADGTYRPDPTGLSDPREATFTLGSGVTIEGGYAGCGASEPDLRDIVQFETILSGDVAGNDADMDDIRGCCHATYQPGCPEPMCEAAVCGVEPRCCSIFWQNTCSDLAATLCPDLCQSRDENAYHVVTGGGVDATAVLDGVMVERGFANVGYYPPTPQNVGGGIYAVGGSPTLRDSIFRYNDVTRSGGGAYFVNGSPTIIGCTFEDNRAVTYDPDNITLGGAIYVENGDPLISDCVVSRNLAEYGGAGIHLEDSDATIVGCWIADNGPTGVHCNGGSPLISDCTAMRNSVGIYTFGSAARIHNCRVLANQGFGIGCDGFFGPEIANCLIAGNLGPDGAGINILLSHPVIKNTTIIGNTAFGRGGGLFVQGNSEATLENSVVWANTAHEGEQIHLYTFADLVPSLRARNSDVQGGQAGIGGSGNLIWESGNIDADPRFVDADGPDDEFGTEDDNPRLGFDSPCVHTGENAALPSDSADCDGDEDTAEPLPCDLDRNSRVVGGLVDMGAYEVQLAPCPEDFAAADPTASGPRSSRFICLSALGLPVGAEVRERALRVTLKKLYNTTGGDPDGAAVCPSAGRTEPSLSQFGGETRWVGTPTPAVDEALPAPPDYVVAPLVCTGAEADVRDWSPSALAAVFPSADTDRLYFFGSEAVPCSVYEVSQCSDPLDEGTCSNPVAVRTGRLGDCWPPFYPEPGQPSLMDISAAVAKFKGVPFTPGPVPTGGAPEWHALLRGNVVAGYDVSTVAKVSFMDIGAAVNSFKMIAYKEDGPCDPETALDNCGKPCSTVPAE